MAISSELLSLLCCPRDHSDLTESNDRLSCRHGHDFPIVMGVPIFLLDDAAQTIGIARHSLHAAGKPEEAPLYLGTIGLSEQEKQGIAATWRPDAKVDAVISHLVGATSGWAYVDLIGKLESYPIPSIPLEDGRGRRLLDVGCNWGRWSVSAGRKGWKVVGIDPSLGALLAAKRAFTAEGLSVDFVCGDARFLPFKPGTFDAGFSYSVIQHFAERDAERAIGELGRVVAAGGRVKVQMAHAGGLRSTYIRTRPDYLDSGIFRVRYWSLENLRDVFSGAIGPTVIEPEAYGGLGILPEDWPYVNGKGKALIAASSALKRAARIVRLLVRVADSVYVTATRR